MSDERRAQRTFTTTVALILSLLLTGWIFLPLWKPLLLGIVFAATVARFHEGLAARMWKRRYLSAGVFTAAAAVLILAPLTILGIVAVRQAIDAVAWAKKGLATQLHAMLGPLPDQIERLLIPLLPKGPTTLGAGSAEAGWWAAVQMQGVASTLSALAFDLAIMMIAFFFVLADGRRLVSWLRGVSPLGQGRTQELVDEFRLVARSTVGSNLLTGLAQAVVATVGYYIAGTAHPLVFGLLTLFFSFIPSVGTSLVALPLAAFLLMMGRPEAALFLAVWALLVVGLVDNLLRPWLIKSDVHIHGAVVFFSMLGGIVLFGATGLIAGPLAVTFFLTMLRFHARDRHLAGKTSSVEQAPSDAATEFRSAA